MRRIVAVILFVVPWALVILLAYDPTNLWLRGILGPTITGFGESIAIAIVNSSVWGVLIGWPYSFIFGGAVFGFIVAVSAYMWHTGWNWARRVMVQSAIKESGMGFREVKGAPTTTAVTNPNPTKTVAPESEAKTESAVEEKAEEE